MIILFIFLLFIFLPDATISSCIAIKNERDCNTEACVWSSGAEICLNQTALNECLVHLAKYACLKDKKCEPYHIGIATIMCIDAESLDLAQTCRDKKGSKEECNRTPFCSWKSLEAGFADDSCYLEKRLFTQGISCYGLDENACLKKRECLFIPDPDEDEGHSCKDYKKAPFDTDNVLDFCAKKSDYFHSSQRDACIKKFPCDKISYKDSCDFFRENCLWDGKMCNSPSITCAKFDSRETCRRECTWNENVKACYHERSAKTSICSLKEPSEFDCRKEPCVFITSKNKCQSAAFTKETPDKPYCLYNQGKICKCLSQNKTCMELKISQSYKFNKIGIDDLYFGEDGSCYLRPNINENRYTELTSSVEASKPVYDCFKNFHEVALLPTCGHANFDTLAYCWRAKFYNNEDYEIFMAKSDNDKGNKMLILLDGCLFCNQNRDYFTTLKVDIEVFKDMNPPIIDEDAEKKDEKKATKIVEIDKNDIVSIIDVDGNFMIALRTESTSTSDLAISVRHRCSDQKKTNFKTVKLRLELADRYPTRVILGRKVAIVLDNRVGNYSEEMPYNKLPGKFDY